MIADGTLYPTTHRLLNGAGEVDFRPTNTGEEVEGRRRMPISQSVTR